MAKVKGILFDYGHTLVYFPQYERTHLCATKNVKKILQDLGVSVEVSRIKSLVEDFAHRKDGVVVKMDEEFKQILSILGVESYSQDDLQEIVQAHWRPYIQKACVRAGVRRLLEYLKRLGFRLGIVANIWSGGMNPVLERLDVHRFFDTIVASVDVGFQKPDPRIFNLALDRLKLTPEQAIMVGDSPRTDIQGAHALGIGTVRLMRGPNRTKPDIVNPDFKIWNLSSLESVVHVYNY